MPQELVARDGKALHRAHNADPSVQYVVSALAESNGLGLGQLKVADQSNEITTLPELWRVLETVEKNHGRLETRRCYQSAELEWLADRAKREVLPSDCAICPLVPVCREVLAATGVALLWRRMGLADIRRVPTRRGQVVNFFPKAMASRLPPHSKIKNIRSMVYFTTWRISTRGFVFVVTRTVGPDALQWFAINFTGRNPFPAIWKTEFRPDTALAPRKWLPERTKIHQANMRGWLICSVRATSTESSSNGAACFGKSPKRRTWKWARWRELQAAAKATMQETDSPTMTDLPPLEYHQTKRVDHRLILRRHQGVGQWVE